LSVWEKLGSEPLKRRFGEVYGEIALDGCGERRIEGFATGPLEATEETKAKIVAALRGAGIYFTEHGVELR
jgi:hypothetical protein